MSKFTDFIGSKEFEKEWRAFEQQIIADFEHTPKEKLEQHYYLLKAVKEVHDHLITLAKGTRQ